MIIWRRNNCSGELKRTLCTSHSQPQRVITTALSPIPRAFCIICLTITCAQVFRWWSNYFTTLLADLTSHQRPDLPTTYESYSFEHLITRNLTRKKEKHLQILKITIQTTEPDLCWCCCCYNKLIKMSWHLEDRALWYILIIKTNEMHYFPNYFGIELYMFQTGLPSIIRSQQVFVMLVMTVC
jgi:hypothetical protein